MSLQTFNPIKLSQIKMVSDKMATKIKNQSFVLI